jgi:heat shock protein HtpX
MAGLLILIGWTGGEWLVAPGWGEYGVLFAVSVWVGLVLLYFHGAENIILSGSSARELRREESPRLFNVVEEMKIASGLDALPRIYLIPDAAPNAFAFGRKPGKIGIAVTRGLMYRLGRDELQGVIAHEMAHLKNRDVQFMTLAAVTIGAVVILSDIVRRTFWFGGRTRARNLARGSWRGNSIILAISLFVCLLGPLMAQLLYFACSRKREYLADACAAQFTRFPEGLASALEKISNAGAGVMFANRVTAPMFIVNPLSVARGERVSLFSTHPPTEERIRILRGMVRASLHNYESAYRQAKGGKLIGTSSLAADQPQDIRAPSHEGAVETWGSSGNLIYRTNGYVRVHCDCGLEAEIPPSYERDEVHCIRCGRTLPSPSAKERTETAAAAGTRREKKGRRLSMADAPPLEYARTGRRWESFRCTCGGTVNLSPALVAPSIRCSHCGRRIDIEHA